MPIDAAAVEGRKELVSAINHSFKATPTTDKILDKLIERRPQGTAYKYIEGK